VSLSVAKANLVDALKQFRARWDKAKDVWDDEARRTFEKDFLEGLEPRIVSAAKGLDHVTELLAQMKRDCADEGPGIIG
jgi:hypothetical protein